MAIGTELAMPEAALNFEAIHADFRSKIHRYLARLVGEYEAEDLTQEVFLKISRALPAFRGESKLSTWVYRIATNTAVDKLRTSSFQRTLQDGVSDDVDLDEPEIGGENVVMGEKACMLEEVFSRKERYECFLDHIKNLPANYRMAVALNELEGMAASEIAAILGLSVNVVKTRLQRGKTRLLLELKSHCKAEHWL